jgi:hypothetical protein
MAEIHRVAIKFCFTVGLSATETLLLVQKEYGNEALNRSKVVLSISRWKEAGRRLRYRWPSIINSYWRKHCCRCRFSQKWPSNSNKNDSRIFEHPQDYSSSDSVQDLGKRKLCEHFVPHSLTPEQREDRVTSRQDIIAMVDANTFFKTKLLREIIPRVLPMTPKQSDRVLNGYVRHPLDRRNWNSRVPHQEYVDNFFRISWRSVQRIRTWGERLNA